MSTNVLGSHVTIMVVVLIIEVVTNVTVLRLDIKVSIVHKVSTQETLIKLLRSTLDLLVV